MQRLNSLLSSVGLELSSEQLEQFDKYYNLLIEKNKVMNLTAITEKDDVILKHFTDSLMIYTIPEFRKLISSSSPRMIDVGTGAGFPGIPLKIAFPNLEVVLLDSLGKRVKFLDEVISELGLTGITALHGRAEEAAHNKGVSLSDETRLDFSEKTPIPSLREGFDLVTSRAVSSLSVLTEYSLPFAKTNGLFIPYKSGEIDDELKAASNAISISGGKLIRADKMLLPDSDIQRSFIIIKKGKPSPKRLPRKAGDIKKKPL